MQCEGGLQWDYRKLQPTSKLGRQQSCRKIRPTRSIVDDCALGAQDSTPGVRACRTELEAAAAAKQAAAASRKKCGGFVDLLQGIPPSVRKHTFAGRFSFMQNPRHQERVAARTHICTPKIRTHVIFCEQYAVAEMLCLSCSGPHAVVVHTREACVAWCRYPPPPCLS